MNILEIIGIVSLLTIALVLSIILAVIAGFIIYTFAFFSRIWLILIRRKLLRWVSLDNTDNPRRTTNNIERNQNKVNYKKKLIYEYFSPLLKINSTRKQAATIHNGNTNSEKS